MLRTTTRDGRWNLDCRTLDTVTSADVHEDYIGSSIKSVFGPFRTVPTYHRSIKPKLHHHIFHPYSHRHGHQRALLQLLWQAQP